MNARIRSLMGVLSMGMVLLYCEKPIQGELRLLVEKQNYGIYSPCWSSDGSKIYFVSSTEFLSCAPGPVWSVSLADETQKQLSEAAVWRIDLSCEGDLCVTYLDGWIRVLDTETWSQLDSIPEPEEIQKNTNNKFYAPKFSYDSDHTFYYLYYLYSDSSYLYRVNLDDHTDELILTAKRGFDFAPGSGDTLFALGDTIYNLNSKERIPIGIDTDAIESMNWNPAVPTELVITTGPQEDLFLFDLNTRKLTRIDISDAHAGWAGDARFSPDGERIVFSTEDAGGSHVLYRIWLFEPSK